MSFGDKKKVDPTAKWSVTFMNEMSKSRGTSRTGDTFNKALFSLIKADIKEPSTAVNSADKAPKTARGANNSATKIGNTNNTPVPSPEVRADTPGDRRSRGLTRSFSLNEITALLAQPVPEEEIRGPESEQTPGPIPAQTSEPTPNPENATPSTVDDTRQTATPTEQNSTTVSDSGTTPLIPSPDSGTTPLIPSPDSGATPSQPTEPVIEANNSTANVITTNNSADSSATTPNTADDTCQSADSTPPSTDADPVTRVKVPPLPVSPRSPRAGRHRHTRSVGSSHALIEHVISPRSKNSETPSSPRDQISPRNSPRAKHDTSPREIVNSTGAVVGTSATESNNSKDKNSSDKKDKKRALKKRSSKRTRPPNTINANNSTANNSTSEESSDSPRSIKAAPNKGRRVSSSVSTGIRRGSVSSDTVPHSPRARTLKHAPKIDSSTIDATTQKLNLDYMDDVLISIKEKLLFPSVKSDFTTEKLEQMPLSWVMQRMPLLRAKRDLAFKHHMHTKQLRAGKVPSSALKKDYLLSNMTRWSSSDINKIRPGPSQSLSLTNTPVKAASNNNLRHVRTGSGPQRRVTSIQLIPASPRDNDPNKETKSSPKSGEEVKK